VVLGDGKTRFEFADREHHHHAVCVKCKKIEDVAVSEDKLKLEDRLITKNDFNITHHTLEFFGICGTCNKL
jgi:Fur family ferric uptake transcriptional regulator